MGINSDLCIGFDLIAHVSILKLLSYSRETIDSMNRSRGCPRGNEGKQLGCDLNKTGAVLVRTWSVVLDPNWMMCLP